MSTPFELERQVWQFQGLAVLLLAPAWAAAARLSATWRTTMRWMAAGNTGWAAALLLLGAQPLAPTHAVLSLSSLLAVAGSLACWRALAWLTGAADDRLVQGGLLATAALALSVCALSPASAHQLRALAWGLCGLVAGVATWRLHDHIGHGPRGAGLLLGAGVAAALLLSARATWIWQTGDPGHDARGVPTATAFSALPTLLALNLATAHTVFRRAQRVLARLSVPAAPVPLQGRGAVVQVLAFEAAQHQRAGRRLALLALTPAALPQWRALANGTQVHAWLAELAARLRAHLGRLDVMGQTEDDVFLVCLVDTDATSAHARVQALQRAVRVQSGTPPDPLDQALSLCPQPALRVGMLMVEPGDDISGAVDVVLWRCALTPDTHAASGPVAAPSAASPATPSP